MYNFWRELSPPPPPPPPANPAPRLGTGEGGGDNVKKGIEGEGGIPRKWKVRKVPKVQGADRSLPETRQKRIFKNSIKNKHGIASYYLSLNEPFTVTLDQIN